MLHWVTHFLTRVATTVRFVGPPTLLGGLRDASEENPVLTTSGFAPLYLAFAFLLDWFFCLFLAVYFYLYF